MSPLRLTFAVSLCMACLWSLGTANAAPPEDPPMPPVARTIQGSALPQAAPPPAPPGVDVLPAMSLSDEELSLIDPDEPTHPDLHMTPDKSEIVRLDRDVVTVIVGNPAHMGVQVENTRTLILSPKIPGSTFFAALDKNGEVIMQRHVIVASPHEKYVRIRKACATVDKGDCEKTQVYYCPEMCHEVKVSTGEEKQAKSSMAATLDSSGGGAPAGAANGATAPPPQGDTNGQ